MGTTASIHLYEPNPLNGQRTTAGYSVLRTGGDAAVCITICDGRGAEVKLFVRDPEALEVIEDVVMDAAHDLHNARAVVLPDRP